MTKKLGNKSEDRLLKTTSIYMIGDLLTRFMQILILPYITILISTEDYGYYDLILTISSLILPVVSVQSIEAVFRYMYDSDGANRRKIASNVFIIISWGCIVLILVACLINAFFMRIKYISFILANFVITIYYKYFQKVSRGLKQSQEYAVSGVIHTSVVLVMQLLLIGLVGLKTEGLILSNIIAGIVCITYLGLRIKAKFYIKIKYYDITTIKTLLRFSAPLVPNSISWWFVATINRLVISQTLGISANGIYAIANKFPALLTVATSIFQLAWQESAIMEYGKEYQTTYYSKIFNAYFKLLMSGYIVLLPIVKILHPYLVSVHYNDSLYYIPLLMLSSVFSAFAAFYGSGYITSKKTTEALKTTMIAAVINCVICISLINFIGIYAAGIGTAVAYLTLWIIRHKEMKSYFIIKIDKTSFIELAIAAVVCTNIYYIDNITLQFIIAGACLIFAIVINRRFLQTLMRKVILIMKR